MISLKRTLKTNYKKWYNDPYVYEKVDDKFVPITFGKFIEESLGIADYLIKKGYKNKNIMIFSENNTKMMETDLAVSLYVGVSAVVSKEWKLDDLLDGIEDLKPACLIYSSRFTDLVKELKKHVKIDTICLDDLKTKYSDSLFDMKIKDYDRCAKIVFSSGTTGKSKGVKLSLRNIFFGYDSLCRRCKFDHNDSTYLFLPLNHTYANVYNFMFSLIAGYSIYLASSTANIGKELLEVNPTIFCAVPLVFNNMLAAYKENVNMAFGKNIKYLFCGGAPLSKETRQIYKDKGLNLMQAYALSETASSFAIAYPYKDDLESAGAIFEDIDVKVYEPDKDGVGEIIVKGDNVFLGYTDKSLTKRVFDSEGYFHTGDLGYIKNGNIILKGRKKKMLLTSNGENIIAASIEDKIKGMNEAIKDVKAYIKDDKLAVNVYVDKEIDVDEVIKEYNKIVPAYERIKYHKVFNDSIDTRLKQ